MYRFRLYTIIVLLILLVMIIGYLKLRRGVIIRKRVQQMNSVKEELSFTFNVFSPYSRTRCCKLKYLDSCYKHPFIPLLIYEGENASSFPQENSWRSNIALDLNGCSSDQLHNHFNTMNKWNTESNVSVSIPYYCWTDNISTVNGYNTSVMTIRGKGTITDLLENGQYNENDETLNSVICLIEVKSNIHWACKGDLEIDNIPIDITSGMDNIGVTVMFQDGDIWYLDKSVPRNLLISFMKKNESMQCSKEEYLSKYRLL